MRQFHSIRVSGWKKIEISRHKNEIRPKMILKDFYKLLSNGIYGKTMENVRNPKRLEFFKKDDFENIFVQQSKLT